jgi:curli production assembly/transport component CsgF
MGRTTFRIVCAAVFMASLAPAFATEQIYHPVNPVLGGNPGNGPVLLSTAQSQGEGVKSGNQGPDLSGLTNALNNLGTNGTTGGGGSGGGAGGSGAAGGSGSSSAANSSFVANPLGRHHPMP